MDMDHYILDADHNPVKCDLMTWARWLEGDRERRRVARTEVGAVHVSTVFLGIDHNHTESGPPVLFETMVFVNETHTVELGRSKFEAHEDLEQDRCCTWDEAVAMHQRYVDKYTQMQVLLLATEEKERAKFELNWDGPKLVAEE